jgi:predicted ATPase
VTSAALIGRGEELAAIEAAVASARGGQARIVLVAGDAGIGKTRLISEVSARLERDGVLCAVGGCVQLGDASLPYAPLIEALRAVRRRVGDDQFAELLGPATATVGVLLGISEGSVIEQSRLFEHVLHLFGRLGGRQPTLMVFEGMHWADASTRDLVAFLGRNLRDAAVALALTYRADELHQDHAWWTVLADLERDSQVERLALDGLDRSELAALLTQLSPDPPCSLVIGCS